MTSPWAWLMLVAMAAASTPHLPLVDAIDFYADRFTDDRDNGSSKINKNDDDKEDITSYTCPDLCTCSSKAYPSTGLSRPLLTVNCSGRGLIEFPVGLPSRTEVLDMSHNKLQNLTSLPRLADLRVLDVSGNWMRLLDNHWVFEHVSKLRVLSLADNALQTLQHGSFSGLGELRDLDLSKNIIKRIELHAFGGLNNLEVLRLDNNELYQLKREWFLALNSLITLHVAHNLVSKLNSNLFSSLHHIQHLDLSHNALQVVSANALSGLNKLKLLNLSGNSNLQDAPTDAVQLLSDLNILLLDGIAVKKLRSYSVANTGVDELSLSFLPRLRVVEKFAFYNLSDLRTLQLHDNPRLVFVHPSAFSNLPSLRHLLLHNNGLIAISSQIMTSLPSLTDLHLYHNPLLCDCNIYWIRKELSRVFHNEYRTKVHSSFESIFASPSSNSSTDVNATSSTSSTTTVTTNSSNKNISITLTFISEPDRVSCFFPMDKSSMPLIQLPLQYFSPTCPPETLPLFSAFINVSLGEELRLECHGLGVPIPEITWILPGGREVNLTNFSELSSGSGSAEKSAEVAEENLLYIKSVTKSDSGSYGCRAVNSIGEDFSTTVVHVQNKPLALTEVKVSNDYITVSWRGSIPRIEMSDFQLYYRDIYSHGQRDGVDVTDGAQGQPSQGISEMASGGYDVIFLHGSIHKCTITGLQPQTTYEVCLVYRQTHLVQCNNYTTTHNVHVVRADGIVRVSKAQIGVGVASVLGVLLLVLTIFLIRRVKHRKDYHDPLAEEEKASIPLEGLVPTAPSTPLTTSRTALLTNSQI